MNKLLVPVELLQAALRYIKHCGANQVMRGEPHPQQVIVDGLEHCLAVNAPAAPHGKLVKQLQERCNQWAKHGNTERSNEAVECRQIVADALLHTKKE